MKKVFIKVEVRMVVLMDEDARLKDVLDDMNYAFDLPDDRGCELIDYNIEDYEITDVK